MAPHTPTIIIPLGFVAGENNVPLVSMGYMDTAVAPQDGLSGYAPYCLVFTATGGSNVSYQNRGTAESTVWIPYI